VTGKNEPVKAAAEPVRVLGPAGASTDGYVHQLLALRDIYTQNGDQTGIAGIDQLLKNRGLTV
jgi:hypothetical protein